MSFNKISLLGNLGKDPELRTTATGVKVCDFSMATTQNKETTWFRVTLWRGLAEIGAKFLKKGSQVYISGSLSVEEWTDKEGVKQFSLKVTADDLQLLGKPEATEKEETPKTSDNSDDIPF